MHVKTTGPGWLTPEQADDPQFKGPVQGKIYPARIRRNWQTGEVSKDIVNVDVDGITWAVWLKPGDQFEGEILPGDDPLTNILERAEIHDYAWHRDGEPCIKAMTTRDCPENHAYGRTWALASERS